MFSSFYSDLWTSIKHLSKGRLERIRGGFICGEVFVITYFCWFYTSQLSILVTPHTEEGRIGFTYFSGIFVNVKWARYEMNADPRSNTLTTRAHSMGIAYDNHTSEDEYKDEHLCRCWGCPKLEGVGARMIRRAPKG